MKGNISHSIRIYLLAADEAFLPDGRFVGLPPMPESLLAQGFRRGVLGFLVKNEALRRRR